MKRSHSKSSSHSSVRKISSSGAKLADIPQDVIKHVLSGTLRNLNSTGFLAAKEQVHLGFSSKSLFHMTSHSRDAYILQKFLLCVAHGEQDKAEVLLKMRDGDPSKWLLSAGEFTDYSGRTFHCTAYEYAYWAKDTYMCRMLGQYMDETTKASMLQRINEMERIDAITGQEIGLTYQQNGNTHRSAHFDFAPLEKALQAYVEGYDRWYAAFNWAALGAAWMAVGKAQRDVPAHIAQEYCRSDRLFHAFSQFKEPTLPRKLTCHKNINISVKNDSWFPLDSSDSGLGFHFAFVPGSSMVICPFYEKWPNPALDLAAITRLDKVRTAELIMLREDLNPPPFFRIMDYTIK